MGKIKFNSKHWKGKKEFIISNEDLEEEKEKYRLRGGTITKLAGQETPFLNHVNSSKNYQGSDRISDMKIITL